MRGFTCSLGLEGRGLLVVRVGDARLEFISLLLLGGSRAVCNLSKFALVLAVGKHLLSAQAFLLKSPEALLILLLLFGHLSFLHLHLALVHNLRPLLHVHALEMVRLDAVGSEHGLLRGRVLRHEVVIVSVVNVSARLELLVRTLRVISVALLLRKL